MNGAAPRGAPHRTRPKGAVLGTEGFSPQPGASAGERASVQKLRTRPHAQVLIIGGGINGVGTFRDLALQGVDVALVERGDYCQGASGASSHMIHGGIRYLENGEFRLVQESVVERNRLLRIAPHYVKPLQTTIPIFSTFSGVLSGAAALPDPQAAGHAQGTRGLPDQARPEPVRLLLPRRRHRPPPPVPRPQACPGRTAAPAPRHQVRRHVLRCLRPQPGAAHPGRAAGRREGRRCRRQ